MRMNYAIWLLVLILAGCVAQPQQTAPSTKCAWPEIPDGKGGCCRDLNENKVCDTIDFAGELAREKELEYNASAEKARRIAAESGKLKRTIVNALHENASKVSQYSFLYEGDEVVVANNSIVRKLVQNHEIGIKEIDGKKYKVVVNTVMIDLLGKKATAQCVPAAEFVRTHTPSPCDNYLGMTFDVLFEDFTLRLPIAWLEDFLHRTPYEALPGSQIGKLKTTLYRFTDLTDAQRKTNLWVDEQTKLPVRVEVWQNEKLVTHEDYSELHVI